MESINEKQKLLPHQHQGQNVENTHSKRIRFFFKISIILIIYKGGIEMGAVTFKQFVYSWCKSNIASGLSNENDTVNESESCGDISQSSEDVVQTMASNWELYFSLLNSVLVFFSVSLFGSLSDYFGRKRFLCLALMGSMLKYVFITVVIYENMHIAWILLPYAIDGFCGSIYMVNLYLFASTADVTSHTKERVFGMVLLECISLSGSLSTQFGNGYYIQYYGYFYPMLTAAIGQALAFVMSIFCLSETYTLSEIKESKRLNINDDEELPKKMPSLCELVKRYTSFYIAKHLKQDRKTFWLCLLVFILLEFAMQGTAEPLTLYQMGSPFCWSSEMIGWYGACATLVSYILGCLLAKPLQCCFSVNVIACAGIVSTILYNVVTGLAPSTLWLFSAIGFGLLKGLPKSIIRAISSSKAPNDLQGAMFAGLESSEMLCKMVASPASLSIYSATLTSMKGLIFLMLAGINVASLVVMIAISAQDHS